MESPPDRCTAFEGCRLIGSGPLAEVAVLAKAVADRPDHAPILIFDDRSAETIELDLHSAPADLLARIAAKHAVPVAAPELVRGPGRPKLGVVAREVTLLPHHWEWLADQPGGASVTLRKLVEQARRMNQGRDEIRRARDALYRFTSVMAGNAPDFEAAMRALFAGDRPRFEANTSAWPPDVRRHALAMASAAFASTEQGAVSDV